MIYELKEWKGQFLKKKLFKHTYGDFGATRFGSFESISVAGFNDAGGYVNMYVCICICIYIYIYTYIYIYIYRIPFQNADFLKKYVSLPQGNKQSKLL